MANTEDIDTLLELISELVDGGKQLADGTQLTLTPQHASICRLLTHARHQGIVKLLKSLLVDANSASSSSSFTSSSSSSTFLSSLLPLITSTLATESECRLSHLIELDTLRSIFGSAKELTVYETLPISFKIMVALDGVDCHFDLGFMLPPHYPLTAPVEITVFVPMPWQGMKITLDEKGKSKKKKNSGNDEGKSIESVLQSLLESRAVELIGECSCFELITLAREFMEEHIAMLQLSLDESRAAMASKFANALDFYDISLHSRGMIERLEVQAILHVQQECDIAESLARALLRQGLWKPEAAIKIYREKSGKSSTGTTASDSDTLPALSSSSPLQLRRQDSSMDRMRIQRMFDLYSVYDSDPTLTLTCSGCLEPYQLRELCCSSCGHALCAACWRVMLNTHVSESGQAFIKCGGEKCKDGWVEEGIIMMRSNQQTYAKYRRFLQDNFLSLRQYKWCPNSATCSYVSCCSSDSDRSPGSVVSCACKAQYCFDCGQPAHFPIKCGLSAAYEQSPDVHALRDLLRLQKGGVDRLIAPEQIIKWVPQPQREMKKCPHCKTPCDKFIGCDHVRCSLCSTAFCWRCLKLQTECKGGCSEIRGDEIPQYLRHIAEERKEITTIYRNVENSSEATSKFILREVKHELQRDELNKLIEFIDDLMMKEVKKEKDEEEVAPISMSTSSSSSSSSSSSISSSSPPARLVRLFSLYPDLPLRDLRSLLVFLSECHTHLRTITIFFTYYSSQPRRFWIPSIGEQMPPHSHQLHQSFLLLVYFVDVLDSVLLPENPKCTIERNIEQLYGCMQDVRGMAHGFRVCVNAYRRDHLSVAEQAEEAAGLSAAKIGMLQATRQALKNPTLVVTKVVTSI